MQEAIARIIKYGDILVRNLDDSSITATNYHIQAAQILAEYGWTHLNGDLILYDHRADIEARK